MRAGWGSLEDTSSLRYWAVAFFGVASALHQHRACFYFKSQGVPVWWLVQDKLYCLCFVAVNKHYKLVGVVQMPHVCSVCCSLLEMMLESSLSDLRDSQGVSLHHVPSLLRLLRLLQDFLFAEGTDNHTLWSEKVRNGLIYSYTLRTDFITHRLLFQSQRSLKQEVGGYSERGCSQYTQIQFGFKSVGKNNCIWKQIIKIVDAHYKKIWF